MAHYHCYVLGPDRHINSRHDIEAADDAEAMAKAAHVAPSSDVAPSIEVWEGARLVGVLAETNADDTQP